MASIKKYQTGGSPKPKVSTPAKKSAAKPAPYYNLRNDYKEPGAKKREAEMIEQLKKKGPMPASQKNVGRKGLKVKKAKMGCASCGKSMKKKK